MLPELLIPPPFSPRKAGNRECYAKSPNFLFIFLHQNLNKLKHVVDQKKIAQRWPDRRIRVLSDLGKLARDEAGKSGECETKKQDCRQRSCDFFL